MSLEKYVLPHVWEKYSKQKEVSMPCRCECGAFVRLVADNDARCWYCPLCGAGYPYVFWAIKLDKTGDVYVMNELVLGLPADPCDECGESLSRPPCRCQRKRAFELNEEIRGIYATIDTAASGPDDTQTKMARIRALGRELDSIPKARSQA